MVGNQGGVFGNAGGELFGHHFQIRTAELEDVGDGGIFFDEYQKQMLETDKFIMSLTCLAVKLLQNLFQFRGKHIKSPRQYIAADALRLLPAA